MEIRATRHSEVLVLGTVYTRAELAERFQITDATLNTGIFQPRGSSSIWLFVTESKTPDRIQYSDRLDGDVLYWQGQTSGRKDPQIIEHSLKGTELLLFYRREKYEYPRAGFRYEGPFRYESHQGAKPASFVLRRVEGEAESIDDVLARASLGRGQRFQSDSVLRRLIEDHAMKVATLHFEGEGWRVEDVSRTQPYDLLCRKGGDELRVEVKGTATQGTSILLTAGEVRHALENAGAVALFVLCNVAVVEANGRPDVRGGEARVLNPWNLAQGRLSPISYEYEV